MMRVPARLLRPLVAALLCVLAGLPIPAAGAQESGTQIPTPGIDELRALRGPFDEAVPTPESVLGFAPGADFQLADWPAILAYLEQLDAASDRMVLEQIGTSAEGQPMVLALISSPENLRDRERYREIAARLARGRMSEAEARQLAHEGKAIVWIDSGLHATEVAHGQHAPELAWMMVAGEATEFARWREDVILLLMPNMNPDGLNIVTDWYRQNLGTPYETSRPPVLYHRYVGHDNNRDWYMITQPETRAVSRQLYEVWYPQIVYNHHQTAPFPARIFVPPFAEPANPNIPPLVLRGIERVGNAITTRLEAEGKPGAISRLGFTAWWNGGMRTTPYFHNMIGILTETALFNYATPNFYPPRSLPDEFSDGTSTREPSIKYPMPWQGGWWRLRDPVEYMLTASMATVDVGSRYREEWLLNMWRMANAAIVAGEQGGPAAWIIPPEQHDDGAVTELVNVLMRGGIEVHRTDAPVEANGRTYAAGSYLVPASQAFRNYAVDLLEPQRYPDRRLYPGGPPARPYDMSGWTLPFQMGVDVDRIERPVPLSSERLPEPVELQGRVLGDGDTWVIDARQNAGFRAVNHLLRAGVEVHRAAETLRIGQDTLPPGAAVIRAAPGVEGRLAEIAEQTGATIRATSQRIDGPGRQLRAPRVGLYEPWTASMDAGWTRFLLETYGFEFEVLRDDRIRAGDLSRSFDAIILPSSSATGLIEGHEAGTMPAEYVGGLGSQGVRALADFARDGGTLVALDRATTLPIDSFDLPVIDAVADLGADEFFCPGSLLRIRVDPTHPVTWGMPVDATAFFVRSRAFIPSDGAAEGAARVLASYADSDLLESGWILGEEHLHGRGAIVEVPMGRGRVVLLGFRVQFRAQPHETFRLLLNSLLYAASRPAELR